VKPLDILNGLATNQSRYNVTRGNSTQPLPSLPIPTYVEEEAVEQLKYTVGIAAYNEEKGIGRLLDFLLTQNIPEILVYDDGSTDKTKEILSNYEHFDNVRTVLNDENLGYGPAINMLLNLALHDIVVIVDADSLPFDGAIIKVVEPFKDPEVGATSGTHVVRRTGKKPTLIDCINYRIYEAKKKIDISESKRGKFMHLNGILFAVRRSVLPKEISMVTNQDAYLGWLVGSKGYKVVFVSDAASLFQPPRTLKDYLYYRKRVIGGQMVLAFQFGVDEYLWHECTLKDFIRNILTATPLLSFGGVLSLIFGAVMDIFCRVYWFHILRKRPQSFNQFKWKQTVSSKW